MIYELGATELQRTLVYYFIRLFYFFFSENGLLLCYISSIVISICSLCQVCFMIFIGSRTITIHAHV